MSDAPDTDVALALREIVKRFGGVTALDSAELQVDRGSVHALLGENGAGKTTLMRVAFGMLRADAGMIAVDGVARRFRSPAQAIAAGLGMVHQHFALVGAMTVAENVALADTSGVRYDAGTAAQRVRTLSAETGLPLDPAARVDRLSVEAQQRVEIIKALARDARVLILDEPTAVLAPPAAAELLAWVRRFADSGRAVVLITHKLREALSVADDVTVLRRGRTVLATPARSVTEADLATAMLGDGADAAPPKIIDVVEGTEIESVDTDSAGARSGRTGVDATGAAVGAADGQDVGGRAVDGRRDAEARETVRFVEPKTPTRGRRREVGESGTVPVVRLEGVEIVDRRGVTRIRGATFGVYGGEIVGIAAVEGEGQLELLRVIAGRATAAAGTVSGPVPAAIGFVPEDRHRDGLILDFPLYENVALRGAGERRGRIRWDQVRIDTTTLLDAFDVRAQATTVAARTLSGGNQQKLVLARELDRQPALLVAENPTRGLDIRASAAVRDRLRAARAGGTAIIFYSSDLDEVLALSDRVFVVAHGAVRHVPSPTDRDIVGRAMLGMSATR